jgi:hypothetical protein
MSTDTLDQTDSFVRQLRAVAADNKCVVVGPVCYQAPYRYVIEAVVSAGLPVGGPFLSIPCYFDLSSDIGSVPIAWGMWRFLCGLLCRDFETVERCGNAVAFVRAVEKHWPCPETTAAREREELKEQRQQAWDARRSSYI